jgi:hypothetical protein
MRQIATRRAACLIGQHHLGERAGAERPPCGGQLEAPHADATSIHDWIGYVVMT